MNKMFKVLLGTSLLAGVILPAQADQNATTFLGPTVQANYTGWFTPRTGYNVLGEVGVKNYRINLTAGTLIDDNNRLKFSAEYLWQRLTYQFLSGSTQQWMQQYALGGDYQYGICPNFSCALDLSAFYSHAPSKNLSTENILIPQGSSLVAATDDRHISGSNAYGVSPGVDFALWQGSMFGVNANYDYVRYDNKYISNTTVSGLGGTAHLNQNLTDNVVLGLLAAVRKPFNNYEASINWQNALYNGRLGLGLFGAYTNGKSYLPNSWNAGISMNFTDCSGVPMPAMHVSNLKGEVGELCFSATGQSYGVVPNAYTPPQALPQRPAQLGPKLPIVGVTFSGLNHGGK